MSDIKIQPSATGTATVTLTAPVTNTARTITFPDSTSTLLASDGSAAHLTSIPAANITGTLPAISGANLTGISTFDPDGAVTINDTGADVDFRVESDDDANMLFVDGGDDRVGIGTATPNKTLDVTSTVGSAGTPNGLYLYNKIHGSDSQIYMYAENDSGTLEGANIKLDPDAQTFSLVGTGGATSISIDDNGYVTQPSKRSAAFCARYSTNTSYSSGATVIYDGIDNNWFSFNYGGGYSTSTGKFTAPVSRVYHFQASAMTTGWGNGDNTQDLLGLIHTNGRLTYGFVRRSQDRTDTYANGYYTEACQVTCYMAANQQVWLAVSQACGIPMFSGYYLV